jgi:hypothetical protein
MSWSGSFHFHESQTCKHNKPKREAFTQQQKQQENEKGHPAAAPPKKKLNVEQPKYELHNRVEK